MSSPFFKGLMILSKPKSKIVDVFCDKCNLSIYFGQNVLFYLQGGLQMPTSNSVRTSADVTTFGDRLSPMGQTSPSLNLGRTSTDVLRNIYGISMEYLWNIYGISLEYLWNIYIYNYIYITGISRQLLK